MNDRIVRVESAVESIGEHMLRLTNHFDAFAERYEKNSRTHWGVLASWAGVVIIIVGLLGTPFLRDIARIEESSKMRIERLEGAMAKLIERQDEKIQNMATAMYESRSNYLAKLSEIRSLEATQSERLRAVERILFKKD